MLMRTDPFRELDRLTQQLFDGTLARPTRYATADDVLADLSTTSRRTKPVPIPHHAPHRAVVMDLARA